jgi:hypothetical protein
MGIRPFNWGHKINYLANKLNLVALNVLDDQDLELGQEVERKLVHGITENGFLNQNDIAPGLLDLLAKIKKILALLLENAVHLPVIVHNNLVLHLMKVNA